MSTPTLEKVAADLAKAEAAMREVERRHRERAAADRAAREAAQLDTHAAILAEHPTAARDRRQAVVAAERQLRVAVQRSEIGRAFTAWYTAMVAEQTEGAAAADAASVLHRAGRPIDNAPRGWQHGGPQTLRTADGGSIGGNLHKELPEQFLRALVDVAREAGDPVRSTYHDRIAAAAAAAAPPPAAADLTPEQHAKAQHDARRAAEAERREAARQVQITRWREHQAERGYPRLPDEWITPDGLDTNNRSQADLDKYGV